MCVASRRTGASYARQKKDMKHGMSIRCGSVLTWASILTDVPHARSKGLALQVCCVCIRPCTPVCCLVKRLARPACPLCDLGTGLKLHWPLKEQGHSSALLCATCIAVHVCHCKSSQCRIDGHRGGGTQYVLGVPPVNLMVKSQKHRRVPDAVWDIAQQARSSDCAKMLRSAASLLARGRRLGSLATEQTVRPTTPCTGVNGLAGRHMVPDSSV